jgi:hypothetical protein
MLPHLYSLPPGKGGEHRAASHVFPGVTHELSTKRGLSSARVAGSSRVPRDDGAFAVTGDRVIAHALQRGHTGTRLWPLDRGAGGTHGARRRVTRAPRTARSGSARVSATKEAAPGLECAPGCSHRLSAAARSWDPRLFRHSSAHRSTLGDTTPRLRAPSPHAIDFSPACRRCNAHRGIDAARSLRRGRNGPGDQSLFRHNATGLWSAKHMGTTARATRTPGRNLDLTGGDLISTTAFRQCTAALRVPRPAPSDRMRCAWRRRSTSAAGSSSIR